MTIIDQVIDAIKRHPHINRIIVHRNELKAMCEEYIDLLPGGGSYSGESRRFMVMNMLMHPFHIMGRPVLTPEHSDLWHPERF